MGKVNYLTKALYLLRNWGNNSWFPNNADNRLIIRNFTCDITDQDWSRLKLKSTPSRKLSDLFWLKVPWEAIKSELTHINILDIGCGSGKYGVQLQSYSNNIITNYLGIDAKYNNTWDNLSGEYYKSFRFHQANSNSIEDNVTDTTNLFITQSAIEHFDEDLHFFYQIRDFIQKTSKSVIQIHLFPSAAQLKLGIYHGIRQYTPRTISKITKIFDDLSYAVLFSLGGKECNSLHWEFITKPRSITKTGDLRETKTKEYNKRLNSSIRKDMSKFQKHPNFYALVIHSNWKEKIFLQNIF